MADGSFPTLVSKDRSSNALSNPMYVQLSDGSVALTTVPISGAVTITSGSVTVSGAVTITSGSVTVSGSVAVSGVTGVVQVSANGTANSSGNPIYVAVVAGGVIATEIQNYDTESTLAADTPDNHDYPVAGTTFMLRSVIFAASGGMKIEVQTGPVGTLATRAVAFIPRAGGFGQINFEPAIEVPVASTGTVRVIRTNRQGAAMDVYTTIIGNDLP